MSVAGCAEWSTPSEGGILETEDSERAFVAAGVPPAKIHRPRNLEGGTYFQEAQLPALPNRFFGDPRIESFRRVLFSAPGIELAKNLVVGSLGAGGPLVPVYWENEAVFDHWRGGFNVDGHGCHFGLLISDEHHYGINKV